MRRPPGADPRGAQRRHPGDDRLPDLCEPQLRLVTYVFGPRLPSHGRCVSTAEELAKLNTRTDELTAYVVEACVVPLAPPAARVCRSAEASLERAETHPVAHRDRFADVGVAVADRPATSRATNTGLSVHMRWSQSTSSTERSASAASRRLVSGIVSSAIVPTSSSHDRVASKTAST